MSLPDGVHLTPKETRCFSALRKEFGDPENLFERIAEGHSLRSIIKNLGFSTYTVYNLIRKMPGWREKLDVARRALADSLAEEVLEIADRAQPGEERVSALQIDSRKWVAGVFDPERFGKQAQIQVNIGEMHLNAVQSIEKALKRRENHG